MSDVTTAAGLAGFLLARIEEDEVDARAALPSPWRVDGDGCCVMHDGHDSDHDVAEMTWQNAAHIARWDPARVLAECEAKRRIVELHASREIASLDRETWGQCFDVCRTCAMWGGRQIGYPCPTIRLLALPYAGHPDFREEWRA